MFEKCEVITETHGLEHPPYQEISVCPCCLKDEYIIKMLPNRIERTEVIDYLLDAVHWLNVIRNKTKEILSEDINDYFDEAMGELWALYCKCAYDDEYPLPETASKLFDEEKNNDDLELLKNLAIRYIERWNT